MFLLGLVLQYLGTCVPTNAAVLSYPADAACFLEWTKLQMCLMPIATRLATYVAARDW